MRVWDVRSPEDERDVPRCAASRQRLEVVDARDVLGDLLDRHVEADLGELLGGDLRCENGQRVGPGRVEDCLCLAQVPARELTCSSEVSCRRVDPGIPESRHAMRQKLVGHARHHRSAARREELLAVEREVDRPSQPRVVPEEGPRGVEGEHADPESRAESQPRLEPVLPDQVERWIEEDARDHVAPVDLVAIDASEQLCGRAPSEVHVEAGEVHLPSSIVVGVATDDDALVLAVLLDVVGAGRGERASSLARSRQSGWDRAEVGKRRTREEVGSRARELDGEFVAARDDSARHVLSPGKHVRCADDVHHVDPPRRLAPELKHAVDRVGECVRLQLLSVAEPEATAERERVGLEVVRDLPAPDHLGLQAEPRRRRSVRICEEPCTGRVDERPARLGEREGGVDVVEAGRGREGDVEDPALPSA